MNKQTNTRISQRLTDKLNIDALINCKKLLPYYPDSSQRHRLRKFEIHSKLVGQHLFWKGVWTDNLRSKIFHHLKIQKNHIPHRFLRHIQFLDWTALKNEEYLYCELYLR